MMLLIKGPGSMCDLTGSSYLVRCMNVWWSPLVVFTVCVSVFVSQCMFVYVSVRFDSLYCESMAFSGVRPCLTEDLCSLV